MADINAALTESRAALDQLITAAEQSGAGWTTPRAPGKWSPSQVVEHVARALDESAKALDGKPTSFPTLPVFVRPIVRKLFFDRIVRKGAFVNGKTNKAMNPQAGPESPAAGRARLERAHAEFERASRAASVRFPHSIFGTISTADYAKFQALHTLHHTKQIPRA